MPPRKTAAAAEPEAPVEAPEIDASLTLAQRVNKARELIGGTIEKKGRNEDQKYDFVSAADVARKVGDALTQVGVLQSVSHELVSMTATNQAIQYASRSGAAMFMFTVKTTLVLMKVEDKAIGGALQGVPGAGERIVVTAIGAGADTGDKGPFKAQTGALKYAQLHALGLATGDDPENSVSEPATAAAVETPRPKVQQKPRATADPALQSADGDPNGPGDPVPAEVSDEDSGSSVGDDPKAKITTAQSKLIFAEANKVFPGKPEDFRILMFLATGKRNSKQLNNQDVSDILAALKDEEAVARAKSPTDDDQMTLAAAEAAGEDSTSHPVVGPAATRDPF